MNLNLIRIIFMGISGMLGAILRTFLSESNSLINLFKGKSYYTNFLINIVGCSLMGLFFQSFISNHSLWDYLICGFVSGFTTFSGFIHDFHDLKVKGYKLGIIYIIVSISFGLFSFYIGYIISFNFFINFI
ncbi:MAG: CrcB family protein [Candidatus Lokiarchaeota archaeon]